MQQEIQIEASNRHMHLSKADQDALFGENYTLGCAKMLAGALAYASTETLTLVGPKGSIEGVRTIVPNRERTQVELLRADCFKLGIKAPLRDSGQLDGSADISIQGPKGSIQVQQAAIVALRHIHCGHGMAAKLGLQEGQIVSVQTSGTRSITFNNVPVHVHHKEELIDWLVFHIDQEEANAAALDFEGMGLLII